MRGRKPEPAAVKRAKGNPGRRPIGEDLAADPDEAMGAPDWLDVSRVVTSQLSQEISPIARSEWQKLHSELLQQKLIKSTDVNGLARYCEYAAEWVYFTRALHQEGFWYVTSSEHVERLVRPHPAFRFRKDTEHSMKELEDRLGLSPVARQRIFLQLAQRVPQQPSLPGMPGDAPQKAPPTEPPAGTDMPFGFLN